MTKKELPITEISLEDFYKLNLFAYELRKHYYNESDQRVPDDKVFVTVPEQTIDGVVVKEHSGISKNVKYSKVTWERVSLNEIVAREVEATKEYDDPDLEGAKLLVAIHEPASLEELKDLCKSFKDKLDVYTGKPYTDKQAEEAAFKESLYIHSYLDKYLTPQGAQTYVFSNYVHKLYSIRDYYEERDLGIRIPKKQTFAIYLINYR